MFSNFSSSDWPNLIYSLLLLVFLISGLGLRSRDVGVGKILKYFAIWGAVAMIAVGLYAYRFEFSDFKLRMAGALNPSAVKLNKEGQMVINLSSDGHFYINAKVNGQALLFMVDTGASDIVIDKEQAQKIGINLQSLNFNKRYETANGVAFGANITLDEMQIGEVTFTNVHASVNSAQMGTSLLGMSFLRKFKKYEFYQDRLVLTL